MSAAVSITFPDKYYLAVKFIQKKFGDLETCDDVPDEKKLALYALHRQAEEGPCTEPAPYLWNVRDRYKHSAWSMLKNMSKPEAMVYYVKQVEELHPDWIEKVQDEIVTPVIFSAKSPEFSSPTAEHSPPPTTTTNDNTHNDGSKRNQREDIEESDFDSDLSHELSQTNIDSLASEVVRLRRLLASNGIPWRNSVYRSEEGSCLSASSEQEKLAPSQDGQHLQQQQPKVSSLFPPPPHASAVAAARKASSPTPLTSRGKAVYYVTRPPTQRIGWLEWLGLSGGSNKKSGSQESVDEGEYIVAGEVGDEEHQGGSGGQNRRRREGGNSSHDRTLSL